MTDPSSDANSGGLSRHNILTSLDGSLRRLRTDHVDLFYCHFWDEGTPIEETVVTLDNLVRQGKVRYLGASNFTGWQASKESRNG